MCDVPVPECMSCQRVEISAMLIFFLLHTLIFVQNHRTKWGQKITAIFVRGQCCKPMSYFVVSLINFNLYLTAKIQQSAVFLVICIYPSFYVTGLEDQPDQLVNKLIFHPFLWPGRTKWRRSLLSNWTS